MKKFLFIIVLLFVAFSCDKKEDTIVNLTPDKLDVLDLVASKSYFEISSSEPWEIRSDESDGISSWLKIYPDKGDAGTYKLTVEVTTANSSYDSRTASFNLVAGNVSKKITITQRAQGAIIAGKKEYILSDVGGKLEINFQSSIEYDCIIDGDAKNWISLEATKALKDEKQVFNISKSQVLGSREGIIIFKDKLSALSDSVLIRQYNSSYLLSQNDCGVYSVNDNLLKYISGKSSLYYTKGATAEYRIVDIPSEKLFSLKNVPLNLKVGDTFQGDYSALGFNLEFKNNTFLVEKIENSKIWIINPYSSIGFVVRMF